MAEIVMDDEKREELVRFISGIRKNPELGFWFIGRYSLDDEESLVCESLRGDIDEKNRAWVPMNVERRPCCDKVEVTSNNPFALLYHCAAEDHIRELISELSDASAKREYEYMLENVFESLTGNWNA